MYRLLKAASLGLIAEEVCAIVYLRFLTVCIKREAISYLYKSMFTLEVWCIWNVTGVMYIGYWK